MVELIREHPTRVTTSRGITFFPRVLGEERPDGTWIGWLEFVPAEGGSMALRTERETSQPSRQALDYWASGLAPVYLEGAFERAQLVNR